MDEQVYSGAAEANEVAPAFDAAAEGKRLLRTARAASLATLDAAGAPFVSLVVIATTPEGRPILLLSRLAAHTGHLAASAHAALLLAQGGKGDPLAHPRLTLQGDVRPVPEGPAQDAVRTRFLARNPKAKRYADFPDFTFWTLDPVAAHVNGGFARAGGVPGAAMLTATGGCGALLAGEAGAVAHMNADHRDALRLYATILAGAPDGAWRASGLDPDGMDLVCGERTARLTFPQAVHDPAALRKTLVALAAEARRRASAA